ncbi:MAG: hypothetical protein V4436_03635 [Patescibacteria group bacterium]
MNILIHINRFHSDGGWVERCSKLILDCPPEGVPNIGDHLDCDAPYPPELDPVVRKRTRMLDPELGHMWTIEAKTDSEALIQVLMKHGWYS